MSQLFPLCKIGMYEYTCIPVVRSQSVFEIKVLSCAHAGCMGSQNCASGNLSMRSSLYKGIDILEKACTHRILTCANGSQNVHTGCTLNFEHCQLYTLEKN